MTSFTYFYLVWGVIPILLIVVAGLLNALGRGMLSSATSGLAFVVYLGGFVVHVMLPA